MEKKSIKTVQDFEAFFQAFNDRNWDELFRYFSDDCVWNASEKSVKGRSAIEAYWCKYHKTIKETVGKPEHVVFGEDLAYLQVPIKMEFLENGQFCGRQYGKGSVIEFWCADFYTFATDGTIKECKVYPKFNM